MVLLNSLSRASLMMIIGGEKMLISAVLALTLGSIVHNVTVLAGNPHDSFSGNRVKDQILTFFKCCEWCLFPCISQEITYINAPHMKWQRLILWCSVPRLYSH